jgi:E3 ubiquitin-protein ligase RNF139
MCLALIVFPTWLMYALWSSNTLSTWLLAVTAFCVEIVIKVGVSLTVYALFMWDAYKETFWEKLDDYVYYVQAFGNTVEFLFGIFLFCNGAWIMVFESGGTIRAVMMCIHAYFNIWCQAKEGWRVFTNRRLAVARIAALDSATQEELEAHGDVCAICFQELKSATVTKCRHFFHAVCLRKWLYVQDKCPVCHAQFSI